MVYKDWTTGKEIHELPYKKPVDPKDNETSPDTTKTHNIPTKRDIKRAERQRKIDMLRDRQQKRMSYKRQKMEYRQLRRQERMDALHINDARTVIQRIKSYNWKPQPGKHINWNVGYDARKFNPSVKMPKMEMANLTSKLGSMNFTWKNKLNKKGKIW